MIEKDKDGNIKMFVFRVTYDFGEWEEIYDTDFARGIGRANALKWDYMCLGNDCKAEYEWRDSFWCLPEDTEEFRRKTLQSQCVC